MKAVDERLLRQFFGCSSRSHGPALCAEAVRAIGGELLGQAYAATAGNINLMAQLLGWSRLTLRDRLQLHGMRFAGEQGAPAALLVDQPRGSRRFPTGAIAARS